MKNLETLNLSEMEQLLPGSQKITFQIEDSEQKYPISISHSWLHSDNGSEFINRRVAKLFNNLLPEFTKSRANRSSDNALIEGRNGAVVRKYVGYRFIASEHAGELQRFLTAHFNPYLISTERAVSPCWRSHPRGGCGDAILPRVYMTPFEKLRTLPEWQSYRKPSITEAMLVAKSNK